MSFVEINKLAGRPKAF